MSVLSAEGRADLLLRSFALFVGARMSAQIAVARSSNIGRAASNVPTSFPPRPERAPLILATGRLKSPALDAGRSSLERLPSSNMEPNSIAAASAVLSANLRTVLTAANASKWATANATDSKSAPGHFAVVPIVFMQSFAETACVVLVTLLSGVAGVSSITDPVGTGKPNSPENVTRSVNDAVCRPPS